MDHPAERLYWRIYMASDNYGTMSGDPWDVWQQACPGVVGMDEFVVGDAIDQLAEAGLILEWSDDDGRWLHLVGHDKHQSADFIRKRGARRTPKPPQGQRRAAKGSEGQGPSPDAVPCPSGEKGTLSTSTSTSTSTTGTSSSSPTPAPDHELTTDERRRPFLGPTPAALAASAAQIAKTLTGVVGDPLGTAEEMMRLAKQADRDTGQRYELAQWEAAAVAFADGVRAGTIGEIRRVPTYIRKMVPSAGVDSSVIPGAVGSEDPDAPMTDEALSAKLDAFLAARDANDNQEGVA